MKKLLLLTLLMLTPMTVLAAQPQTASSPATNSSCVMPTVNRIDLIRPDARELARHGADAVGVRTLQLSDSGRLDVLNVKAGQPAPDYDRPLAVEVWYPAELAAGQQPGTVYETPTRNPALMATLHGRAVRDAAALRSEGAFPLVILSHGYPGNRYLMSHLGENLASKGYVVVSIDHTDSTYTDQKIITRTL